MQHEYWHKQQPGKPLFPDIEWQKPEQKSLAGKLLIIGGNSQGFAAVALAYRDALAAGAGECRVILPDTLKGAVDPRAFDCLFVPSNPSGGMSKDALMQLKAGAAWADALLLIGDAGRNSETAITLELLLSQLPTPTVITRDSIDLLNAAARQLLQRERTVFVATFAQLQKLFQAVYYPKIILFSMSLLALIEALHKFTITYPVAIVVLHQEQLVVAKAGQVSTTPWAEPMLIWRGSVAAKLAVYLMQHPNKPFEAITSSLV
jgi:NAD(P)H-hydrate repair Nnr-like enzyme with NAD(P)H-hydrate dehydratase domain